MDDNLTLLLDTLRDLGRERNDSDLRLMAMAALAALACDVAGGATPEVELYPASPTGVAWRVVPRRKETK